MELTNNDILLFIDSIKGNSKYDFSDYTEKSFQRRVEKVLTDNKMTINEIVKKLASDKIFLEKTVKDITVNTTELLRDPQIWIQLKNKILPELKDKETIQIWHAGCSSGQEVYSMLVLLCELGLFEKTIVIGTDLNSDILEEAKKGVYKFQFNQVYLDNFEAVLNESESQAKITFEKYFEIDKSKDLINVKPFLKKKPFFKVHDLVKDGNNFEMKFDLILCRNVLIYFNTSLQNRVFELFHNSLKDDGSLIIGVHESILGPQATKFDKKGMYYKKKLNL